MAAVATPARRPPTASVEPDGEDGAEARSDRGTGPAASESADPLADLRAENEALRTAIAGGTPSRLVKELFRLTGDAAAPRPAGSALFEASPGGGWSLRAEAGEPFSTAALRTLPGPQSAPERPRPLADPAPSLKGAWVVPLAGAGRTGLWVAPPPPTGGDEGRGRRLWEAVGEALWTRYTSGEAIAAARGALALRDAQIALHAAAAEAGEPQAVLTRLLDALARAGGADRALLHTTGPRGRRIAGAGAALSGPVAAVAAEQEAKLAAAAGGAVGRGVVGFDQEKLREIGVRTLIGRAAVAGVGGGAATAALLLVKADPAPFPPHARPVLAWAADFFADVLPRCTRAAAVTRLARRDALTGLANRRAFDERLAALTAETSAGGGDLTLLMCDLDHFKSVNDTHGHAVGDEVLKAAADAIREVLAGCRSNDVAVAARYGGEELVVLLPNFGPAGGMRVAERVREAIAEIALPEGGERSHASASVGAAVFPFDAAGPNELLRAADDALYAAKTGGRNRVARAGAAATPSVPR